MLGCNSPTKDKVQHSGLRVYSGRRGVLSLLGRTFQAQSGTENIAIGACVQVEQEFKLWASLRKYVYTFPAQILWVGQLYIFCVLKPWQITFKNMWGIRNRRNYKLRWKTGLCKTNSNDDGTCRRQEASSCFHLAHSVHSARAWWWWRWWIRRPKVRGEGASLSQAKTLLMQREGGNVRRTCFLRCIIHKFKQGLGRNVEALK